MTDQQKLDQLLDLEGYDLDSFLDEFGLDSVVLGICMNEDCDYTTDVEPDCQQGFCENCETQTVKSGLILAGVM